MTTSRRKTRNLPPEESDGILSVYDSMAHCAGGSGIPLSILRHAKKGGCAAFDGSGRVRIKPLLVWIFSQDTANQDWTGYGKKFSALNEEVRYHRAVEAVIDRDEARSGLQSAVAIFFAETERVFGGEFPAAVKGLSEIEIKKRSDAAVVALKDGLRKRLLKITEPKHKPTEGK